MAVVGSGEVDETAVIARAGVGGGGGGGFVVLVPVPPPQATSIMLRATDRARPNTTERCEAELSITHRLCGIFVDCFDRGLQMGGLLQKGTYYHPILLSRDFSVFLFPFDRETGDEQTAFHGCAFFLGSIALH
jgi:hypothetical protein